MLNKSNIHKLTHMTTNKDKRFHFNQICIPKGCKANKIRWCRAWKEYLTRDTLVSALNLFLLNILEVFAEGNDGHEVGHTSRGVQPLGPW